MTALNTRTQTQPSSLSRRVVGQAQRLSSTLGQQAAAAGLAAVTTLALLSSMVMLAGGYQAELQLAQQVSGALAASAPQQVMVTGRRSPRG